MPDICTQYEAAFRFVSAYVVLHKGKKVATVAFKYPRNGTGRLYCYLHVLGVPMVSGRASGGGYDKKSAAFHSAAQQLNHAREFATLPVASRRWHQELELIGYEVLSAL